MKVAPLPVDETQRIDNLLSYGILDSPQEKDFDDLVELTAQICNCKYALISFVDAERQWFKAKKGIPISETPRDIAFCSHTILDDQVLVVKDTKKDDRFFDNPFVTDKDYRISFYAGTPIISEQGFKLGTVCAMDDAPKTGFSVKQKNALRIISNQVSALLNLKVKNKLVLQNRDDLVAEEKKIVEQTITEQEEEKNFIANELHENFAQTLAATKLYLDFAEQSKELSAVFIKKCKANILQIIKDIKALSKSMLPSTFQHTNYLEFIQEMLDEYGKQNDKRIKFIHKGKLDCYDSNIGLTLFRVIQYQLKNAHNCGAKKISIRIKTDEKIKLVFLDDGKEADAFEPERKLLLHHIETRINLVKGKVKTGTDKKGNNQLEIEIPLIQEGGIK